MRWRSLQGRLRSRSKKKEVDLVMHALMGGTIEKWLDPDPTSCPGPSDKAGGSPPSQKHPA